MGGEKGSLVAPSLPVLVVDVYGMSVESFAVKITKLQTVWAYRSGGRGEIEYL
jgi:hypothetical protein